MRVLKIARAGAGYTVWSSMFLLGHDSLLTSQSETILYDSGLGLLRKPFLTKKQLNPSRFDNENYKLIAALHSVRGTVMQDTTAAVNFT